MVADVVIVGYGLVRVGEYWNMDVVSLGVEAASNALVSAGSPDIGGVYVGSALSSSLGIQGNVSLHIADELGVDDCIVETISSGASSSGLAFLNGMQHLALRSSEYVLVGGVEKISDNLPGDVLEALLVELDRRVMKYSGLTEAGLAAILSRLYMDRFGVSKDRITYLSVLDHENGVNNPYAMFRRAVNIEMAMSAPIVADPLTIFDVSPYGDGAAFLVLTTRDKAVEDGLPYIEVGGYGISRNRVPMNYRDDLLAFEATSRAVRQALGMAGLELDDIDFIELFDTFTITGVLALEAIGASRVGRGAEDIWIGAYSLGGPLAINTFGGLKSRGHPIGATGMYQLCEAVMRLRDGSGFNRGLVHMMSGFDDLAIVVVLGGGGSA